MTDTMQAKLNTVEIEPRAEHRYSIIWLHGLGADGHDFEPIAPELRLALEAHVRFVFPEAPFRPITINGGMVMRAWFDINELTRNVKVDVNGIYESVDAVKQLIDSEIDKGIPPERIVLAGFSQGGAIAIQTGLTYPQRLGGIVALSTFLPTLAQLKRDRSPANQDAPIFVAHGIIDSIVDVELGKNMNDQLRALGYRIEWHDYMMDHAVCRDEIDDIGRFLDSVLR